MIYDLTPPSHRPLLDAVQNASIRICTGAFRNSPALSLRAEAGVQPLHYRRLYLTASLLTSILHLLKISRLDILFNLNLYVTDLFIVRHSHKFVSFLTTLFLKASPSIAFPLSSTLFSHHGLCYSPASILKYANFSESLPTLLLFAPTSSKL